jgi:hypothetical protein
MAAAKAKKNKAKALFFQFRVILHRCRGCDLSAPKILSSQDLTANWQEFELLASFVS